MTELDSGYGILLRTATRFIRISLWYCALLPDSKTHEWELWNHKITSLTYSTIIFAPPNPGCKHQRVILKRKRQCHVECHKVASWEHYSSQYTWQAWAVWWKTCRYHIIIKWPWMTISCISVFDLNQKVGSAVMELAWTGHQRWWLNGMQ